MEIARSLQENPRLPPLHNLNRSPLHLAPPSQYSFLQSFAFSRCVAQKNPLHKKTGRARVFGTYASLTKIAFHGGNMAVLDVTKKAAIYHNLHQPNSAFADIVGCYQRLRETGVLTTKSTPWPQPMAPEAQPRSTQASLL